MTIAVLRVATWAVSMSALGCFHDVVPPPGYDYVAARARDSGVDGATMVRAGLSDAGTNAVDILDGSVLAPTEECDLTGRWLATLHQVVSALGAVETIHTWIYFEIVRQGDSFQIVKGLYCGDDVTSSPALNVKNNTMGYWHTAREKVDVTARTVTSAQNASGCTVHFGKWYMALGLSDDYVTNPSLALPTVDQPASAGKPGWEDWEPDGHPGITAIATSNIVGGQLYTAMRSWNESQGRVPNVDSRFTLPVAWDQEVIVYGATSPLLQTKPDVSHNPVDNFVQLARLTATQAAGDDNAVCDALIPLASTLTPEAAGFAQ